ncbi:MAG: DUF4838 domain-containing protein [Lentisphaerae bacterium]|nr:DUF4838 domain-containing protein [Lentisphaerota bacterium]
MTSKLMRIVVALVVVGAGGAGALTLVEAGRSPFVIHVAADAPGSVRGAAEELQRQIQAVTGVSLPIQAAPAPAMICLGDNAAAAAAGVSAAELAPEAFRWAVREGSLFILGPDTPDGQTTRDGGVSTGTRNGVHRFVETALGVRWLLPGPDGDYTPRRDRIEIAAADHAETPGFRNRRLPYIQPERPEVRLWSQRQNLGHSLVLLHGHNLRAIRPEAFAAHPEWFAEHGGRRTPPSGEAFKYCLSNPGVAAAFAAAAAAHFEAHPESTCFSLSPSDGGGWCECADCRARYEVDPLGHRSVTPAVIAFYNDVARLVRPRFPEKTLAGYVYAEYVFPPQKPFTLEPNVFLVWAPSFDYGYTLFRPDIQALWDSLVPQWTRVTPNLAYYDLPTSVSNPIGAPNPPGLEILRFLYPRLRQHGMQGVYVYGHSAWGHAAVSNYLLARLSWDPDADVEALFNEFCDLAYAEGAAEMKSFYRHLDAATRDYFLAHPEENYTLSSGRLKAVYAGSFETLEGFVTAAAAKITDAKARARLEMLEVNLRILHWTLRQNGHLPRDHASRFALDDDAFAALVQDDRHGLALQRASARPQRFSLGAFTAAPGRPVEPAAVTDHWLRGRQDLVLRAQTDGPVTVRLVPGRLYGSLIWVHLFDGQAGEIRRGVISPSSPFRFEARAGECFGLTIQSSRDFYRVEVDNADWGLSTAVSDEGLHLIQKVTPLYVHVPAGVERFSLWLAASPPGETAAARLISPRGREAAVFDCSERRVDQQAVAVEPGEDGFWRLDIRPAATGVLDDVYVRLLDGLAPWVVVQPAQGLIVHPEAAAGEAP